MINSITDTILIHMKLTPTSSLCDMTIRSQSNQICEYVKNSIINTIMLLCPFAYFSGDCKIWSALQFSLSSFFLLYWNVSRALNSVHFKWFKKNFCVHFIPSLKQSVTEWWSYSGKNDENLPFSIFSSLVFSLCPESE